MSQSYELKTWVVMLHGRAATVFANNNPGGVLMRVRRFPDSEADGLATEARTDQSVAAFLEEGRRVGGFERWMVVASASRLEQLRASLSSDTRALLSATRTEDLSSVPVEEMRWHVPEAACL